MSYEDYERSNRITALTMEIMLIASTLLLSGCSPSSALTGLIGSKPEITAQAGAENVKQTVGITAKQDESSKQETSFKESTVGKVDTSNKKKVSTSTIQADTIKADTIQVVNGGETANSWQMIALYCLLALMIGGVIGRKYGVKKGA